MSKDSELDGYKHTNRVQAELTLGGVDRIDQRCDLGDSTEVAVYQYPHKDQLPYLIAFEAVTQVPAAEHMSDKLYSDVDAKLCEMQATITSLRWRLSNAGESARPATSEGDK